MEKVAEKHEDFWYKFRHVVGEGVDEGAEAEDARVSEGQQPAGSVRVRLGVAIRVQLSLGLVGRVLHHAAVKLFLQQSIIFTFLKH